MTRLGTLEKARTDPGHAFGPSISPNSQTSANIPLVKRRGSREYVRSLWSRLVFR